ncbi:uncharacterized protein LOC144179272 isoform X1 [Haemaphysalis longicornis]
MGRVKLKHAKGRRDAEAAKATGAQPMVMGDEAAADLSKLLGAAAEKMAPKAAAGETMTKKEKRQIRHHALLKKLEAGKVVKSKGRRRKKAPVPKSLDMKHLLDALPTLKDRTALKPGKTRRKPRASQSFEVNKKLLEKDMKHLEAVTEHPHFRADPMGTVLGHLRQMYKP